MVRRLDPGGLFVQKVLSRTHCTALGEGKYIKDLSLLGRQLSRTVLIDGEA